MTMNQQQTKYAREKLNIVYNQKQREINDKYNPKYLNTTEMLEALKAGEFTFKDKLKEDRWGGSGYVRDFVQFDAELIAEEQRIKRDELLKELSETKSRMMDELILGDVQEALSILRSFEAKEY